MPPEHLHLRVLTPQGPVLDEDAGYVVLRSTEGDYGVLPGHSPSAVVLGMGLMQVYKEKQVAHTLFVMGGTAWVQGGAVTVLSPIAGGQKEVEEALARLEAAREERRAEEQRTALDIQRAEVALRNALVQLDVSAYSILDTTREDDHAPS